VTTLMIWSAVCALTMPTDLRHAAKLAAIAKLTEWGISARPPASPAFRRVRGVARVAQLAANGHRHPATPIHTGPRNTCSGGTPSHVWHHSATLCDRLTVKQVHRQLVLDFADPGGIGGTTTGNLVPITGTLALLSWRRLRGRRLGRSRSRGGSRPDVRYEEPGWVPGDWLAVLSPWWPGPIAVNRAWASSSWAAIMSLTPTSSGVSAGQASNQSGLRGRRAEPERYRVR
jgi:hypothetical protein